MGQSEGRDTANPLFMIDDRPEGAVAQNGRVMGTYLHGLFENDDFRKYFLANLNSEHQSHSEYHKQIDEILDNLAAHIANHLDLARIAPARVESL